VVYERTASFSSKEKLPDLVCDSDSFGCWDFIFDL